MKCVWTAVQESGSVHWKKYDELILILLFWSSVSLTIINEKP